MMHGQTRSRKEVLSEEEIRHQEEKSQKLLVQMQHFLKVRRGEAQPPEDPLTYCELMGKLCPEIYTILNYRREILIAKLKEMAENAEGLTQLLVREFELNTGLIKRHPKSYTLWTYRQWLVIESERIDKECGTTIKPYQRELALCSKMLTLDERNFHVWNYRNWVTQSQGDIEEFTLTKIKQNFSNFSAYHFRSKGFLRAYNTIPFILKSVADNVQCPLSPVPIEKAQADLTLVREAIYIQPKEFGVYLYHRWLLGVIQPYGLVDVKQIGTNILDLKLSKKVSNVEHGVQITSDGVALEFQKDYHLVSPTQEYRDTYRFEFVQPLGKVIDVQTSNNLLENKLDYVQEEEEQQSKYYVPVTFKLVEGRIAYQQLDKDTLDGLYCIKSILNENLKFIGELLEEEGILVGILLQQGILLTYLDQLNKLFYVTKEERLPLVSKILETYQQITPKDPSVLSKIAKWQAQLQELSE